MNQYQKIVVFWGYTAAFLLNLLWIFLRRQFDTSQQVMIVLFTVILYATSSFFLIASCKKPERRRRLLYRCWFILFFYYLFVLIAILFLDGFFFTRHGGMRAVNLIPFRSIHSYWQVYLRDAGNFIIGANLFGNLVLFAPMGFFLPLFFPALRKWYRFFIVILLLTVGVEGIQYLTQSGSTDIDDVILNVTGAFIVYLLVQLLLRPNRKHK